MKEAYHLGEWLRIDRTTMVGLVDGLEALGPSERRPDPADRRAYAVTVTPERRALLQRARTVVTEVEREFLAPRDADETAVLIRLLLRLMA